MNDVSKKRIESSTKRLAEAINKIEVVIQDVQWACEAEKWNDDVAYDMKEAQVLLGQSLATLVNWFDEPATDEATEEEDMFQKLDKIRQDVDYKTVNESDDSKKTKKSK